MRHRHPFRPQAAWLLLVATLAFSLTTRADDVNPPPYDGQVNSVGAFWQDSGAGLQLGGFGFVPGIYPLSQKDLFGGGAGQPALDIDPVGPYGDIYSFFIPNFVDSLPLKLMRIQVTYFGTEPILSGIIASDSGGPVQTAELDHVIDAALTGGALYYYEDWQLWPNPDWEIVQIFVPGGSTLHQVVIDTISTPLPPAVWLLGTALAGLMVVARRRAAATKGDVR